MPCPRCALPESPEGLLSACLGSARLTLFYPTVRFSYYNRLSREARAIYRRSDAIIALPLPAPDAPRALAATLAGRRDEGNIQTMADVAAALAGDISRQFGIEAPRVVLFDEPRPPDGEGELHGLYEPEPPPATISIWMRTAKRLQIIAYRTLLRTILHEVCHHLDYEYLELEDSFHTEGFFRRESDLYRQLTEPRG